MNTTLMLTFKHCTTHATAVTSNAALNFAYGVAISPLGDAVPARRSVDTV